MYQTSLIQRIVLSTICAIAALLSSAATANSASVEEKSVVASFQAMLDGLGKRDKAAMMAQLLPGGGATLMRGGKPVQINLGDKTLFPDHSSRRAYFSYSAKDHPDYKVGYGDIRICYGTNVSGCF